MKQILFAAAMLFALTARTAKTNLQEQWLRQRPLAV